MRLNESTMNDGWDGVMDKVIEVEGRGISKDLALVALQVVNGLEREDAALIVDNERKQIDRLLLQRGLGS